MNENQELSASQVEMAENIGNPDYWKRRLNDPDDYEALCQDWHGLALVAGKETKRIMREMVDERFNHLEGIMAENNKNIVGLIEGLGKDQAVTERRVNDHSQRISLLESGMANIALNQAQVIEMVKMGNSHTETIAGGMSDMREMLVDIAKKHINQSAPKPPAKSKTAWMASVPAIGYVVAGVVSIAFLSAITGHLSDFFAYLSTVKVFGGVK